MFLWRCRETHAGLKQSISQSIVSTQSEGGERGTKSPYVAWRDLLHISKDSSNWSESFSI